MSLRLVSRITLMLAILLAAGSTPTSAAVPRGPGATVGSDRGELVHHTSAPGQSEADARAPDDALRHRVDVLRKRTGKSPLELPAERWCRTDPSIQLRRIEVAAQVPAAVTPRVSRARAPPAT